MLMFTGANRSQYCPLPPLREELAQRWRRWPLCVALGGVSFAAAHEKLLAIGKLLAFFQLTRAYVRFLLEKTLKKRTCVRVRLMNGAAELRSEEGPSVRRTV